MCDADFCDLKGRDPREPRIKQRAEPPKTPGGLKRCRQRQAGHAPRTQTSSTYHKQGAAALDPLRFGECRPHLEPNRATGQAYKGGVDRGHFSACVDKKGTLFSFTTCPPCQPAGHGVRGYWLDE